jgi:hypothetical protein
MVLIEKKELQFSRKKMTLGAHHKLVTRNWASPPFCFSLLLLLRRVADVLTPRRPPYLHSSPPGRAPRASSLRGGVGHVPRRVPRGRRARGVPIRALPPLDHPPRRRGGWGPKLLLPAADEVPRVSQPRPPPLSGGPGRLRARHPHPLYRYSHNAKLVK